VIYPMVLILPKLVKLKCSYLILCIFYLKFIYFSSSKLTICFHITPLFHNFFYQAYFLIWNTHLFNPHPHILLYPNPFIISDSVFYYQNFLQLIFLSIFFIEVKSMFSCIIHNPPIIWRS